MYCLIVLNVLNNHDLYDITISDQSTDKNHLCVAVAIAFARLLVSVCLKIAHIKCFVSLENEDEETKEIPIYP